jgi:hypothetical protein
MGGRVMFSLGVVQVSVLWRSGRCVRFTKFWSNHGSIGIGLRGSDERQNENLLFYALVPQRSTLARLRLANEITWDKEAEWMLKLGRQR